METEQDFRKRIDDQLEYFKKWKDDMQFLSFTIGDMKRICKECNDKYDFIKSNIYDYNRGKKISSITNILSIAAILVIGQTVYQSIKSKEFFEKSNYILEKKLIEITRK